MYSQDGYKLLRAEQLGAALFAFTNQTITFKAFRAYMGCLELLAIREATQRSAKRQSPRSRFRRSELEALLGERNLAREISSLRAAQLLTFSEPAIRLGDAPSEPSALVILGSRGGKRLVPVPRQVLKFLARCTRPALAKTIIAYLLRGLSLDRSGQLRTAGTVKISWICSLCRISERAARAARAELIRCGWITKDTGSFQRKLNRDGAYFVINPFWRRRSPSAPRAPKNCTRSAPPKEKQETSIESKNQKPAFEGPGVRMEQAGEPTLHDIQPEDLKKPTRLEGLYHQAVTAGWIQHSEANVRNFISAALRATRAGGRVGAIFAGLVKRRLWHHITQEQEDRAVALLKRLREHDPNAFRADGRGGNPPSQDVTGLISALTKSGGLMLPGAVSESEPARRLLLIEQLRSQKGRGASVQHMPRTSAEPPTRANSESTGIDS